MTPYQIIVFMLKMIAKIYVEYPPDLLAARRAAFIAQVESSRPARQCETVGNRSNGSA